MPLIRTLSGNSLLVDLETRDFEGFRSDILDTGGLADTYAPSWTDRSEMDLGVALVESFAFMADNLSYYQDRMANEAFLQTAVQRRSVIEHCKLIGYELHPASSARAICTIVVGGTGPFFPPKTLLKYSVLTNDTSTGDPNISFFLKNDLEFDTHGTYSGTDSNGVDIEFFHATVVEDEAVGISDGTANQSYSLDKTPLTNYSTGDWGIDVYVDSVLWTRVDNFLDSGVTDKHYRVIIDEQDVIYIYFGDGLNGMIPSSSGVITATYLIGGGQSGNKVAVDKLTKLTAYTGSTATISSITNSSAPSGGLDRETIAQAKVLAPKTFRSFNRAVTHEDYAALALNVPGVLYSYAHRGAGAFEERVVISSSGTNPVPAGTWDPLTETGTDLVGAVGQYLNARKTTPTIIWIDPVRVIDVYLEMEVFLESWARKADLTRLINDTVIPMFYAENINLGVQIPISNIYAAVENLSGVDYLNINRFQRIPNPKKVAFGSNTDITIGSFIVGSTTKNDSYRIKFTNATDFDVTGVSSGYVGSGTLDTQFTASDSSFSFTAATGTISPTAADKWDFTTGVYLANIDPEPDELVALYNGSFTLSLSGGLL